MDVLNQIINNKCIYIPFLTWLGIQTFKCIVEIIKTKKFNFKRLLGAGGMPSSHSAVVCSLAVLVGKSMGFYSEAFAISVIMACIVMYDAAGVRRAAGKQARLLNKIMETPGLSNVEFQEKLVEVLGHTPVQVIVGAFLGIVIGIIF